MKRSQVSMEIDASAQDVFHHVHDYSNRLQWDTMLRKAVVLPPDVEAGMGVRTACTGTWASLGLRMVTEYISFTPGEVAAVRMTRPLPFFRRFAATIRHKEMGAHQCHTIYIYHFQAKPSWLAWLLEPLMDICLRRETHKRLHALKVYAESHRNASPLESGRTNDE